MHTRRTAPSTTEYGPLDQSMGSWPLIQKRNNFLKELVALVQTRGEGTVTKKIIATSPCGKLTLHQTVMLRGKLQWAKEDQVSVVIVRSVNFNLKS